MSMTDTGYFPQPEWNEADSLSVALDALRNADDQVSANSAYDRFLNTVGNDHAGTFYPIVLAALPEVAQIVVNGGFWAQRTALELLIDLGGAFIPEPGHETYLGASVQQTLRAFIQSLRPHVAALANGDDARSKSASELLELIDDLASQA